MAQAGIAYSTILRPGSPAALDGVYRKIAWRILPILIALWIVAFMDRTAISFARLQMLGDLHMDEAAYGLGASIFYLGYVLFEVPSNLLLRRIGARKTLARIGILWGVTCLLMMFVRAPWQLYVLRVLLGVFEAGLYPGGLYYLTTWLPTDRRNLAIGFFSCSGSIAGVIGGPLSGFLLTNFAGTAGWSGWQWVFLVEGLLSVIVGLLAFFVLTNTVGEARWLSADDRKAVAADLERDVANLGPREHRFGAALRDSRVWIFCFLYFCVLMGYVTTLYYGPAILHEAGITSPATIGWIVGIINLASAIGMISIGGISDRVKDVRKPFSAVLLLSAASLAFLGFSLPGNTAAIVVLLLLATTFSSMGIPATWPSINSVFAGTAAAAVIALVNTMGNVGAFISPYVLGVIKQSTGSYSPGLWLFAATSVVAAAAMPILVRLAPKNEAQPAGAGRKVS